MKTIPFILMLLITFKSIGCSVSGDTNPCKDIPIRYTTQSGKTNYMWTIPTGGYKAGGGNSTDNYVDVVWTASPGAVSAVNVTYYNANWTQCSASINVTIRANQTPAIAGQNSVCYPDFSTNLTYTTDLNKTNYQWSVVGGTILSGPGYGQGLSVVKITWNSTGNRSVSVRYTNSINGCWTPYTTYNVTVHPKPAAPVISGPNSVCNDNNPLTTHSYSMSGATGTVHWYANGGTITNGSTSNPVSVNWTSTAPVLNGYYNAPTGCMSTSTVYPITITNPVAAAPTATHGNNVCLGSGYTYNAAANKTNYQWTVVGGTIDNGANTRTISVTWNTSGAKQVCVSYAENGCQALNSVCLAINVGSCGGRMLNGDEVTEVTGVDNDNSLVNIYPVPADRQLLIVTPEQVEVGAKIALIDLSGRTVYSSQKNSGESSKEIDTSKLSNGWYLVRISSGDKIIDRKVLVKH